MKLIILISFLSALSLKGFSQDKDVEAQVHYLQAEELYNKCNDTDLDIINIMYCSLALRELEKAEDVLNMTNPKILYLKIKTLGVLCTKHYPYLYAMDTSLKKFFSIVDEKSYPKDKYLEIVQYKINFEAFSNALAEVGTKFKNKDYSNYSPEELILADIQSYDSLPFINFEKSGDIKAITFSSPKLRYSGFGYNAIVFNTNSEKGYLYGYISISAGNDNGNMIYYYIANKNKLVRVSSNSDHKEPYINVNSIFRTLDLNDSSTCLILIVATTLTEPVTLQIAASYQPNSMKLLDYFNKKRLKQINIRTDLINEEEYSRIIPMQSLLRKAQK